MSFSDPPQRVSNPSPFSPAYLLLLGDWFLFCFFPAIVSCWCFFPARPSDLQYRASEDSCWLIKVCNRLLEIPVLCDPRAYRVSDPYRRTNLTFVLMLSDEDFQIGFRLMNVFLARFDILVCSDFL
uniref:Uncharacterized protein n=1 Tax=Trichobilharzia regenti TaxID=157069 RepID=A0AA85J9Z7_TRIRE|nr:unnamed protein product [Trichobilharzia regenti]